MIPLSSQAHLLGPKQFMYSSLVRFPTLLDPSGPFWTLLDPSVEQFVFRRRRGALQFLHCLQAPDELLATYVAAVGRADMLC